MGVYAPEFSKLTYEAPRLLRSSRRRPALTPTQPSPFEREGSEA